MFKIDHKKGQAATELAVFGAILIFLLGAIVRTAVSNNYAQNQNFKAMRMAMLASWEDSKVQNAAHNSASLLFLEDRLSPDFNKYGDLERSPFIANGSGTFSYGLLNPVTAGAASAMLPVMDVYINGQHFPFSMAAYITNQTIQQPVCSATAPTPASNSLTEGQCLQNRCLRNQREWVPSDPNAGGTVNESQFLSIVPVPLNTPAAPPLTVGQTIDQIEAGNAHDIFTELVSNGMIDAKGMVKLSVLSGGFVTWYKSQFPGSGQAAQLAKIQNILQANKSHYKLFYAQAINATPQFYSVPAAYGSTGTYAPTCPSHPCKDKELSVDATIGGVSNATGDLLFDLQRNSLPSTFVPTAMRQYMTWQWYATAGVLGGGDTSNGADPMIGLIPNNNQYPQYDINGTLKPVTIYSLSQDSRGDPIVSYEDPAGGDIDGSWDANSCTSKPGLQNNAQIFAFTKAGTYLLVKDGKLYNPETDQFVRSVNKRDSIDLIQRMIQLSNNTGRFCSMATPVKLCSPTDGDSGVTCANPNDVEVCVDSSKGGSCFTQANFPQTCFDAADNMLYVRSRVEDRRGRFWMTDTAGQLSVK